MVEASLDIITLAESQRGMLPGHKMRTMVTLPYPKGPHRVSTTSKTFPDEKPTVLGSDRSFSEGISADMAATFLT